MKILGRSDYVIRHAWLGYIAAGSKPGALNWCLEHSERLVFESLGQAAAFLERHFEAKGDDFARFNYRIEGN